MTRTCCMIVLSANQKNPAVDVRCYVDAGPMYQAGTLSGNPLAMTAGIKTLEILDRPGTYEHLDRVTGKLIQGILDAGREAGHEMCGGHISGESLLPQPSHWPPQARQDSLLSFLWASGALQEQCHGRP